MSEINLKLLEENLNKIGISLRDENGEVRKFNEVLNDLSKVWDDLSNCDRDKY
jgi:hypothetical protein